MMHISPEEFAALPRQNREQILLVLAEMKRREAQKQFYDLFPDDDIVRTDGTIVHARAKYPKHIEFFSVGKEYRERCFLAANRVGKTTAGGFELTTHLTGEYPEWWPGRRFPGPIRAWACGKNNETTRDIVQASLLGEIVESERRKGFSGTGMIPGARIGIGTWKRGVADLCDTIKIRHASGGWSLLGFKSYEQGRGSFEGTAQHVILLDEECPVDIYGECVIRTMTTNGLVMLTFTPLEGLTETVLAFMPNEERPAA
ncbi:MAG: terminase family protein [Rhizobiaceae bacterium]|nr:terminase family protein [Rhizobiaceae bacterium]MCV0408935.1 terminase family protein [Rhizobiaceae bacterium]